MQHFLLCWIEIFHDLDFVRVGAVDLKFAEDVVCKVCDADEIVLGMLICTEEAEGSLRAFGSETDQYYGKFVGGAAFGIQHGSVKISKDLL